MAVLFAGGDVNLYTQIGMIMLIGLGAKNAVLIVEYAIQLRKSGQSIFKSGTEAANLRFRAVMMTALSFLLGVLPLVVASGAGAGSQQAIGIAVFGGMLFASSSGVRLTPILYVALQSERERLAGTFTGLHTAIAPTGADEAGSEPPLPPAVGSQPWQPAWRAPAATIRASRATPPWPAHRPGAARPKPPFRPGQGFSSKQGPPP